MTNNFQQTCPGCGAKQSFEPNQASLKCSHCGTEMAVEFYKEDVPSALEADLIIPATVAVRDLRDLAHVQMTRGKHTPDDLLEKAQITETVVSFVPIFLFRGKYKANWSASFGYDRQEAYTAYRTVNGEQQAYTAYRTVTDWRPASGVAKGSFAVKVEGGQSVHPNVTYIAESMSLGTVEPYSAKFVSGFPVGEFNTGPNDAFVESGESKVKAVIDYGVKSHAQGNRQRDWRWTAKWDWESSTVLVPIAKASFEYEEKSYSVWFNGSDPTIFMSDALPQDQNRKKAIRAGFLPAIVAAAGTVIAATIAAELAIVAGVMFVAAIVFGFVRRRSILTFSKSRREAYLIQKRAGESTNNDLSEEELEMVANSYTAPVTPLLARTSGNLLRLVSVSTGFAVVALSVAGLILQSRINSGNDYGSSSPDSSSNSYDDSYIDEYGPDSIPEDSTNGYGSNPTAGPDTNSNSDKTDTSWAPADYYAYGDGTSFAWKWDQVSSCDNSATEGCWIVIVATNVTCEYGLYVSIEQTDPSGAYTDTLFSNTADPFFAGDEISLQVNSTYSGDSGRVVNIQCM
jgi:hypothetical protein